MAKNGDDFQGLIVEFQKMIDVKLPTISSQDEMRKIYFDLAVKHFLYQQLKKEFFSYRFLNEAVINESEAQLHLKFIVFSGEALPPVPKNFWITHDDVHYLCDVGAEKHYQEITLQLKTSCDREVSLGSMPVFIFDETVNILKKHEIGHVDFLKDLFASDTKTPELCSYYINQIFGLRASFDDLKLFLQNIDKREWERKLRNRTKLQSENLLDYFVPSDLDRKLMLTQEEVDLLLAKVR